MNVKRMRSIFDQVDINGKAYAKNRICRSATEEGICENGDINDVLEAIYTDLASGGAGMIVSGMTEVSETGLFVPGVAVAYHDDYSSRLGGICETMRAENAVFLVQLTHSGMKSRGLPSPTLAPSAIKTAPDSYAREITAAEIKAIISDFAAAAYKAKLAGAHGVQIHNAHGYLLSTFFSPYTNRRTDIYGGSIENRGRIILEVYDAVRKAVGDDFIVGIKTNCSDLRTPSITIDECVWLLQTLESRGLDYAEISAGIIAKDEAPQLFLPEPQDEDEPVYYRSTAYIADRLRIPVYSVCGWRDPDIMEKYLNQSAIAGISMCRPFICEPGLVNRWKSGDLAKSKCIECFVCGRHSGFAVMCEEAPAGLKAADSFSCVFRGC